MNSSPLSSRTFVVIAAVLIGSGLVFTSLGVSRMFSHWDWLEDLHYFYEAAQLVTSGQTAILYDPAARLAAGYGWSEGNQVFPYPAPVAYLYWPLIHTDLSTARYIFVGVTIAAMAGVSVAAYLWSRDWPFTALTVLLPASSFTFYETVRFNQLAPILALMLCVAMLSSVSRKSILGGLLCGLLVLKPSIAALPLLLLTLRRGYVQIAVAAVVGAILFIVLPLVLVGIDGIRDYMDLLSRYREESFNLDGQFTAGAGWMLGWQSIVGRLMRDDPNVPLVLALSVVTVIVMLLIWRRGNWLDSWFAAVTTTLLIIPHVVWYDWMVLMGLAPFVAYRHRSMMLIVLLLALHMAVSFDSYLIVSRPVFDAYPVPTPLLAFATLVYLALRSQPEPYEEEPARSQPARTVPA